MSRSRGRGGAGIKRHETAIAKRKHTGPFDFEETGDGHSAFELSEAKVAETRRRLGSSTILATDTEATARRVAGACRERDEDKEELVDPERLLGARRPRAHSQKSFESKYDILLVSLILAKFLRERLGVHMGAHRMTSGRCLMKLTDVRAHVAGDEVRLERACALERRELLGLRGVNAGELEGKERTSSIAARASRHAANSKMQLGYQSAALGA